MAAVGNSQKKFFAWAAIGLGFLGALMLAGCVSWWEGSAEEEEGNVPSLEAATVVRVVDGDTLIVSRISGLEERVRLIGIDAPESVSQDESRNSEEGTMASAYMHTLVSEGASVWLEKDVSDTDQYGRLLRYVWLEKPSLQANEKEVSSKMLNALMVKSGYAQAKRYSPDTVYSGILTQLGTEASEKNAGVSYFWS